jgi:hypothetical protein
LSRWKKPPAPTPQMALPMRKSATDTSLAAAASVGTGSLSRSAPAPESSFPRGTGLAGDLAAAMIGTLRKVNERKTLRTMALAATVRGEILDKLRSLGGQGATADELAQLLRRSPFTTRPRCTELQSFGQIHDSGQRRKNASGRNAIVWVIG